MRLQQDSPALGEDLMPVQDDVSVKTGGGGGEAVPAHARDVLRKVETIIHKARHDKNKTSYRQVAGVKPLSSLQQIVRIYKHI